MPRKQRSDSVAGRLAAAQAAGITYDPPAGLDELTEAERASWNRYISARSAWKSSQLAGLHRLVKLETMARRLAEEASQTPAVYEKASGDLAPHPVHSEARSVLKVLHSELRLLGLQVTLDTARTDARHGVVSGRSSAAETTKAPAPIDWSLVDK